jgi:soluble lytic murein transglycosylase-like protein
MDPTELTARLPPRLAKWAPQFLAAQLCYGVDAALMAAVVDRESLGGDALTPKGNPGGVGDHGNGRGLAQIDARYHHRFIVASFDTGEALWTDPTFNILYGARLLRRCYDATGSWPVAIAAYNAGLTSASRAAKTCQVENSQEALVEAVDRCTTGGNYVSDVYRRCASFSEPV